MDDIKFLQFQAVLTGEVICLEKCPVSQLSVRLTPKDQFGTSPIISQLEAQKSDPKRATFSFKSVSPGTYDLEVMVVHGDTLQAAGNWCWGYPGLLRHITVIDRDLHSTPELVFQQTGYRLHLEASLLDHGYTEPIDLKVTPSIVTGNTSVAGSPLFYRLTQPLSVICLPGGSYTLEASTPCLHLHPPAPRIIHSTATEISLSSPPKTVIFSVNEIPFNVVLTALSGVEGFSNENSLPDLTIQAHIGQAIKKLSTRYFKSNQITSMFYLYSQWLGNPTFFLISVGRKRVLYSPLD